MLGYDIYINRQQIDGATPATFETAQGALLASWSAHGLDWIKELAASGLARDLGGNDYPSRYTAQARHLLSPVRGKNPPEIKTPLSSEFSRDFFKVELMDACPPEEWLVVEVWDQS